MALRWRGARGGMTPWIAAAFHHRHAAAAASLRTRPPAGRRAERCLDGLPRDPTIARAPRRQVEMDVASLDAQRLRDREAKALPFLRIALGWLGAVPCVAAHPGPGPGPAPTDRCRDPRRLCTGPSALAPAGRRRALGTCFPRETYKAGQPSAPPCRNRPSRPAPWSGEQGSGSATCSSSPANGPSANRALSGYSENAAAAPQGLGAGTDRTQYGDAQ